MGNGANPRLYLSSHLLTSDSRPHVTDTEYKLKPTQKQVYLVKYPSLSSYLPCKVLTAMENIKTVAARCTQEKAESCSH